MHFIIKPTKYISQPLQDKLCLMLYAESERQGFLVTDYCLSIEYLNPEDSKSKESKPWVACCHVQAGLEL